MMGSQWTSKYAILRDLSFAQGREVPAAIVDSIGVGQKPPTIRIIEDTEEEFFQSSVGGGDAYSKPDLNLIKHMINMVHESGPANEDDDDDTEISTVQINKLNPLSEEFVPKIMGVGAKNKGVLDKVTNNCTDNNIDIDEKVNTAHSSWTEKVPKKRKERNVALMSLLEGKQSFGLDSESVRNVSVSTSMNQKLKEIPEPNNNIHGLEIKLLKPNDFIIDKNISDSVEKVNEWLKEPQTEVEKVKAINISPENMFKKKILVPMRLENTCMFKRKSDTSSDSNTVSRHAENVFVPTTHANEYYKKFIERHQVQEKGQEDIWKRAERLMKEIDDKRLKEKEQKNSGVIDGVVEQNLEDEFNIRKGPSTLSLNFPGVETASIRQSVLLLQHRHELPEQCKVCLAFAKYKRNHEKSIIQSSQE